MRLEEINRTLVEAESGCWNEWTCAMPEDTDSWCRKCNRLTTTKDNPDFSKWENFGRLLKIAKDNRVLHYCLDEIVNTTHEDNIDQIPLLVATELASIIKEKK